MDPLVCYYVLLADPLIPAIEVQMGTVLYFSDPRLRTYDLEDLGAYGGHKSEVKYQKLQLFKVSLIVYVSVKTI